MTPYTEPFVGPASITVKSEIQPNLRSDHIHHKDRVWQIPDFGIKVNDRIVALWEGKPAAPVTVPRTANEPVQDLNGWTIADRRRMCRYIAKFLNQFCKQAIRWFRADETCESAIIICSTGLVFFKISFPRSAFAEVLSRPEIEETAKDPNQKSSTTASAKAGSVKDTGEDSDTGTSEDSDSDEDSDSSEDSDSDEDSADSNEDSNTDKADDETPRKPYSYGVTQMQDALADRKENLAIPNIEYSAEDISTVDLPSPKVLRALYEPIFGTLDEAKASLRAGCFIRAPLDYPDRNGIMKSDQTLLVRDIIGDDTVWQLADQYSMVSMINYSGTRRGLLQCRISETAWGCCN